MEWTQYWENFIEKKKLIDKVNEMNVVDNEENNQNRIEKICHDIYYDYENYSKELEKIRLRLLEIVETFPNVYLRKSRVKHLDSLLEKVIIKRHQHLLDRRSLYSAISADNYKDILTDLIGIRLIINYRGRWEDIHNSIIKEFPYPSDIKMFDMHKYIPHPASGDSIIAERPVAYYAYGDDISMYEAMGVQTKLRENGYRSVHYIISFQRTYIEIQARTIYDEAWSDCDHSYVYKHEENASHTALEELSCILCKLTNVSDDLGEEMRKIYCGELINEIDSKYETDQKIKSKINKILNNISEAQNQLEVFEKRLK